jgi:ubiquinone/menaquinone biosynthesis C-methylase UbiE
MNVKKAYNLWAEQYDTNKNRTRDLEAMALRISLPDILYSKCLEVGCGTGKNTVFLADKAAEVVAIDLSEAMLARAALKLNRPTIRFLQADINAAWEFEDTDFDLVTFSLVLEHIENLDAVFEKVTTRLKTGGIIYIGELHPFKQYNGTKARFDTAQGRQEVTCFTHHVSEFTGLAHRFGFEILTVNEYFDEADKTGVPRILSLIFKKR